MGPQKGVWGRVFSPSREKAAEHRRALCSSFYLWLPRRWVWRSISLCQRIAFHLSHAPHHLCLSFFVLFHGPIPPFHQVLPPSPSRRAVCPLPCSPNGRRNRLFFSFCPPFLLLLLLLLLFLVSPSSAPQAFPRSWRPLIEQRQ